MAGDKDTSRQLRDLADLRDQLEQVRDRIEGEVQGSVVLSSPFYRGCLIGLLIGRLRGAAFLGASVGLITGAYAAQNYNLPNVGETLESWFRAIKGDDED